MSGKIITREFSIDDYDAALRIWERVKGIEIAEGDDRESVAQFLARNPGLSRVAADGSAIIAVALCGHDGRRGHVYHLWWRRIIRAAASSGSAVAGRNSPEQSVWELTFDNSCPTGRTRA